MYNHKHIINTINSIKIPIWLLIFPKTVFVLQIILQQLIKTKNQSLKTHCIVCNLQEFKPLNARIACNARSYEQTDMDFRHNQ